MGRNYVSEESRQSLIMGARETLSHRGHLSMVYCYAPVVSQTTSHAKDARPSKVDLQCSRLKRAAKSSIVSGPPDSLDGNLHVFSWWWIYEVAINRWKARRGGGRRASSDLVRRGHTPRPRSEHLRPRDSAVLPSPRTPEPIWEGEGGGRRGKGKGSGLSRLKSSALLSRPSHE
ncbi:hypothetical protein B7494_g474 [Chlorociboria aeruginascens]|nr:hypothetical protein B7494_g474 [Chlorociboria aeruginascens]